MATQPTVRIEFPSRGQTYRRNEYGIYRYDEYPVGSVLEGQQRRTFLGSYSTLEEAMKAHPEADYQGEGVCGFQLPYLDHLPDDEG